MFFVCALCFFVKLVIPHHGRELYFAKVNKLQYLRSFGVYLRHLKLHVLSRLWTSFPECAIGLCPSADILFVQHMIHLGQLKSVSCCLWLLGTCVINWLLTYMKRRVDTDKINFAYPTGSISTFSPIRKWLSSLIQRIQSHWGMELLRTPFWPKLPS